MPSLNIPRVSDSAIARLRNAYPTADHHVCRCVHARYQHAPTGTFYVLTGPDGTKTGGAEYCNMPDCLCTDFKRDSSLNYLDHVKELLPAIGPGR